ncbi:MAG: lamin tail domain-containing protein [Verrucomicrobia bacterium]|nr:lamin tail domain-containing protein [Verrucomicrobiota bacterium]
MNSFFIATNGSAIDRILRSKYSAFRTNNLTLADPAPIRTWITQRRAFLSNELRRLKVPFAVTTPRSLDLTQSQAGLTLAGIAPPDVESIWINGSPKPVLWTTLTNWSMDLLLEPGETLFALQARGLQERVLPGLSQIVKVNYQAAPVDPVGRVVINEIQFHPPNSGAEFVEVLNVSPDASFDLSGWRISGLDFVFPQGSILGPRGYLVVAADATAFGETYGWSIPLAGVFNGTLDPQGEWLRLMRPLPGGAFATVDEVRFSSDPVWAANLTNPGMSLELRDPTQDRRRTANWSAVSGALSTESQPIVAMAQSWRFLDTGEDLGVAWRELNFNDSEWPSGVTPFFNTADPLIIPKTTPVNMTNALGGRILTHYFRTEFRHEQPPLPSLLRVGLTVDDGAVVYLNGREMLRRRMPNGLINFRTLASSPILRAAPEPSVWVNVSALLQGRNVLAVEVHQATTNQNDLIFTLDADLKTTPSAGATPGAPNRFAGAVPAFPSLWISEIQPRNLSGIRDSAGERDPWLELINGGTSTVSLDGFQLSINPTNLRGWSFPPGWQLDPGRRLIIWLDGQPAQTTPTELHSSLRAENASGVIILSQPAGETLRVIDHLLWTAVASDESFGRIPDTSFEPGRRFHFPTPGVANDGAAKPVNVWINEWMASNARTIADPADGDFEDWFELFNASDTIADLSGYTLTDDLVRPQKYVIPPGVQIPPGGFLRVWADEETGQNRAGGDVHAAFRLSGSGEALGLFAPNGVRVDTVVFGRQTDDVSEGRFGDGAAAPFLRFSTPTPGFPNQRDPLTPGIRILEAIPSEDGSLTLRWTTQPAWRYQVTYKNELSEAVWRPLGGVVQSMGPVAEARDAEALSGDRKFYRIEQIQSAGAP